MLAFQTDPARDKGATVEAILALLMERANPLVTDGPVKSAGVLTALRSKIERSVETGTAVEMVLPAFPAKSPNPEKTLGHLPDYGEVLALRKLDSLCRQIEALHTPGARLIICSDGRVFNDLVRVNDEDVNAYSLGIREILSSWGLDRLSTFDLDDVFQGFEFSEMRRALVHQFAEPVETIHRRTRQDPNHRSLFNGIHRFLFEDRVVMEPLKSRTSVREETKSVAYEVIQRSNAWSGLVQKQFPGAVRLSIHPQGADSEKLGVKLLPSRNVWRTPWHGVVVGEGERFELSTRRAAVESGAKLSRTDCGYGYFKLSQGRRGWV